ncbi:MAG: response regulator [Crocinitomicaceae bacterium]|nr:response regulator [Crocinitomicaceae bacterium]
MRVGIIENEFITRLSLTSIVKRLGFEVVGTGGNFDEAIKLTYDRHPDVLLLDSQLKGEKDGFDVAKALAGNSTRIIFVSNTSEKIAAEKLNDIPHYAILTKPIDNDLLVKQLLECAIELIIKT